MSDRYQPRLGRRLFWVSVAAAVVSVMVAAVAAIHRGYVPIGDNAFFAIRARDVFSRHPPLLGTWTSASLSSRTQFNNPGPLLFDLLAPTTRALDGSGLVLGVALLNSSAIVGIALVARRCGGPLLGTAAMAVVAGLCWGMGSHVLIDPTQPSSLLLPFLCFTMLVWALTCGDLVALPWAAAVGSLVLESYVTYGFLVVALGVWALVGLALQLRIDRGRADSWPARRRRAFRMVALTLLVYVICWAQPLFEQFTGRGEGNLTLVARAVRDPGLRPIGFSLGTRLVAQVVALPPWWVRPSFKEFLAPGSGPPSIGVAIASLTVLVSVLGGCACTGWRRHCRASNLALSTAAVLLVAGLLTAGRTPIGVFGGPTPHTFRWLWPLGAFVVFSIAASLAWRAPERLRIGPPIAAFTLAAALLASLNLAPSDQGAAVDEADIPVVRDLGRQLASLEGQGPLLVNLRGVTFGDPYGTAVLAQLQRRSIPFVTDDGGLLYQLGPSRRFTGRNARARLLLREGENAEVTPLDARRVALHRGLTARQRHELAGLEDAIAAHIASRGLRLNRRGLAAVRKGDVQPIPRPLPGQPLNVRPLFRSRLLLVLAGRNLLALDPAWTHRFQRYVQLQSRSDRQTVALFLAPVLGRSSAAPPGSP